MGVGDRKCRVVWGIEFGGWWTELNGLVIFERCRVWLFRGLKDLPVVNGLEGLIDRLPNTEWIFF